MGKRHTKISCWIDFSTYEVSLEEVLADEIYIRPNLAGRSVAEEMSPDERSPDEFFRHRRSTMNRFGNGVGRWKHVLDCKVLRISYALN